MNNELKISVRLDDICPTMNWTNFYKIMDICNKYNVKPLLGVVPENKDKKLIVDEKNNNFFDIIRKYQEEGISISQHGLDHVYKNKKGGILKLNKQSDIVGLKLEEQKNIIQCGKNILEKNGIKTDIYMAPSHSYDRNTILALKELGFRYVTDGYTNFNYEWLGLTFIPCMNTYILKENVKGIHTLCLHLNTMSNENLQTFENTLKKFKNNLCNYSDLLKEKAYKHFKLKQFCNLKLMKVKSFIGKILRRIKK